MIGALHPSHDTPRSLFAPSKPAPGDEAVYTNYSNVSNQRESNLKESKDNSKADFSVQKICVSFALQVFQGQYFKGKSFHDFLNRSVRPGHMMPPHPTTDMTKTVVCRLDNMLYRAAGLLLFFHTIQNKPIKKISFPEIKEFKAGCTRKGFPCQLSRQVLFAHVYGVNKIFLTKLCKKAHITHSIII